MQENFVCFSDAMRRTLPEESLVMEKIYGPKVPNTNLYDKISSPLPLTMDRYEILPHNFYWPEARIEQKIARAVRTSSHSTLPQLSFVPSGLQKSLQKEEKEQEMKRLSEKKKRR
uniref:Uncharacterized protein n=1 Tax=Marseillevirus sp. TaxID=2809551 RepID=A0AA96EPP5_9VIRU|nr:hypothetical protein MarFTMF_512 [Marseillevirus sp.]